MSNVRVTQGWKSTERYKEIRWLLKDLLGTPNYVDHIENGVSFKWYLDKRFLNEIPPNYEGRIEEFVRETYPQFSHMMEIKFLGLPEPRKVPGTSQRDPLCDSFRILVRFK